MIFGHSLGHELLRTRSKDPCLSASAAHSCQGHRLCGWERSDYAGSEGHSVAESAHAAGLCGTPGLGAPARRTYLAKIERDTVRDTKLGRPATLRTILRHGLSLL